MTEEFIRLKDWDRIYDKYMNHIEDRTNSLKEELKDGLENDWDYSAMQNSREWYTYVSLKNMLKNIDNDILSEVKVK